MTCTDCNEPITESERRAARTCVCCSKPMHAECSMIGIKDDDTCEACLGLEVKGYADAMQANSNLRHEEDLDWWATLGTDDENEKDPKAKA
jgi:hypothetical protein